MATAGRLMSAPVGTRRPSTTLSGALVNAVGNDNDVPKNDPEAVQQSGEVAGPADRDRRGGEGVLEHEVPADEPGHHLAERRVGIGIGAARDGQHGRELRVAQARECAGDARDHEREDDCRTGMVGGGVAGHHEDAGADDRADPEHHEVARG